MQRQYAMLLWWDMLPESWHRRCLVGQSFTCFPLQASGGSHLLEISRSRWPQAPRGVQPYHSTNLSDRWVYCCTPHTQKPQHWSQKRKIPLRGFSASLLLSSLAPVVHSLCLMLCETVNTELGDVNGLPGIRGGVRGESLYQRSRESYVKITCVVSLPLMHHMGASRHRQLCHRVDVIDVCVRR